MNNYYDIGDVITDGQKIPCRFNITVPGLGYLQGDDNPDINKDTKLELPFWMAELLALSGITPDSPESFVTLLQPDFLSLKVLNSLKTDPLNLDLRLQSPVFHGLVERWLSVYADQELAETISQSMLRRSLEISDVAGSLRSSAEQANFLSKLDDNELKLYKISHEAAKDMKNWLTKSK